MPLITEKFMIVPGDFVINCHKNSDHWTLQSLSVWKHEKKHDTKVWSMPVTGVDLKDHALHTFANLQVSPVLVTEQYYWNMEM